MKIDRVLELLKIERECVTRQSPCNERSKLCDRNCGECDIAQNDLELIEMYDFVISMIETLIGDRLTRLMAERGLCAADVARMLDGGKGNWSAAAVRKWMTDESQPSAATLVGLADILGCSLDYLMTGKEYTPKRTLDSTPW